ncbi:helix-turn-helix domain-containing protein [Clostridium kluyveri]|uniref:HTH cro/C1-type domain-containing protein n=1 Tax=Clostridium kluyveri TaxID=1534 RepID=A0A1L5F8V5_CLOKL|nr:helix-turn-helix transcriptional regulator [Clostridium kluyveri]APM39445.1 hypothetical protein BS101_12165 [Clostridium kluyveri]
MSISENLKRARNAKGLSQRGLAEKANVSYTYINRIEREVYKNPSYELLNKLAIALEIPVESLYKENNEKELSLLEILQGIYENTPDMKETIVGQLVKGLIENDLMNPDGTIPKQVDKQVKDLIIEASRLQAISKNIKKGE